MNAQQISDAIDLIKVDSIGRRQGVNKAISKIHSQHLRSVDNLLMDIRVYVAKISTGNSPKQILTDIDNFIYQKQTT
jgi:hypothetical protein